MSTPSTLGIIAGNRKFPQLFAQEARRAGVKKLVAIAFEGETDPAIAPFVDVIEWMKLGQLTKLMNAFRKHGVRDVVMVGQIAPSNLFANVRLDMTMTMLLARLKRRNAETIFGAIGEEFQKNELQLVPHAQFLDRLIPQAGILTRRKPSRQEKQDFDFAWRIGKTIASLDIGQTVVVKGGTVLAVEAFEGTDGALLRGGGLAAGAVAVKLTKPGQDMRFDIPCVGSGTIETLRKAGITAFGIEAGRTLFLEKEMVLKLADDARIAIEALKYPES